MYICKYNSPTDYHTAGSQWLLFTFHHWLTTMTTTKSTKSHTAWLYSPTFSSTSSSTATIRRNTEYLVVVLVVVVVNASISFYAARIDVVGSLSIGFCCFFCLSRCASQRHHQHRTKLPSIRRTRMYLQLNSYLGTAHKRCCLNVFCLT